MYNLAEFERQLFNAGVIDPHSSVRGTMVWLPYGMKIMSLFSEFVRHTFHDYKFEEYFFPTFISANEFKRITEHIKDFSARVYWIDEQTLLRPSGEGVIYPMFRRWIRTHADLPLRVYQIGSSFRPGTPRGLYRANEANPFIEGHTAHGDPETANEQLEQNIALVKDILSFMGVPVIISDRPLWTNNPVGERIIGFDTLLPIGETLLTGSAYAQMQIFSRPFGIRFLTRDNKLDYTYQTTLGFSSRILIASLMLHADERGLRLLPPIAPYQVVIVPIFNRNSRSAVLAVAEQIKISLENSGIRVHFDAADTRADQKFFAYEVKGVPLRIEVGQREIDAHTATLVRRDEMQRFSVGQSTLVAEVVQLLENQTRQMQQRVIQEHERNIVTVFSSKEIAPIVTEGKVAKFSLCRNEGCLRAVEKMAPGEVLGYQKNTIQATCLICDRSVVEVALLSRRV